ncbi:MAG: hypothetical protein M1827_006147 [Pycnora praestabilis]|nr:MAG: hypothetical protein M1827_006147 [Pycnora praestabilis]
MALGGAILRTLLTFLRAIQFLAAALILGIFSYFLAVLHDHHLHIPTWEKAVEGMSGAAVLYTIFAILLTCFLGGVTAFAFLAILLDLCFVGCFIAVAVLTRQGAHSCKGIVNTPIGTGQANSDFITNAGTTNLKRVCRLNKAAFAVAIALAVLFLLSMALQFLLNRHHKKEKAFGPSPANNYTSGPSSRGAFWKRKNNKAKKGHLTEEAELGAVGVGGLAAEEHHRHNHAGIRPSHDTNYTGSTMATPDAGYRAGGSDKYVHEPTVPAVGNHTVGGNEYGTTAPPMNPGYVAGAGHGYGGNYEPQVEGGVEHAEPGVNISGYGANNSKTYGRATNY